MQEKQLVTKMSQQYLTTGICRIWTVCSDLTYLTSKSAHVISVGSIDCRILSGQTFSRWNIWKLLPIPKCYCAFRRLYISM